MRKLFQTWGGGVPALFLSLDHLFALWAAELNALVHAADMLLQPVPVGEGLF